MRQWKKQQEWEQRFNKRLRALDVGVVRGKKASGKNAELYGKRAEKKKVGPESTLESLSQLVKTGGEGLTDEEKQKIVDDSKKALMEKIQLRMKE